MFSPVLSESGSAFEESVSSRGAVSTFKAHSHPPTPSSEGPSHPGQGRNCQMLCLPADCFGEQGERGGEAEPAASQTSQTRKSRPQSPCTASASSEVQRATLSSKGRFQCPKGTYPEFKLTPLGGHRQSKAIHLQTGYKAHPGSSGEPCPDTQTLGNGHVGTSSFHPHPPLRPGRQKRFHYVISAVGRLTSTLGHFDNYREVTEYFRGLPKEWVLKAFSAWVQEASADDSRG